MKRTKKTKQSFLCVAYGLVCCNDWFTPILLPVPQVWKALASVLHMSNVAFDGKDDVQGEVAAVRDPQARKRLVCFLI